MITGEEFSHYYDHSPQTLQILEALKGGARHLHLNNNMMGHLSLVASSVFKHGRSHHLFILRDKEEAAYMLNDLEQILGNSHVLFFPGSYRRPYQVDETDNANVVLRAEVLNLLGQRSAPAAIVTYPEGIFEKVITRTELQKNMIEVAVGNRLDPDFLTETLIEYHFQHVDFVVEPGQFSLRGGIMDVFSFSNDLPYRIEFFDDQIESIRVFDVESQISEGQVKKFTILPNVADKKLIENRDSFLKYLSDDIVIWHVEPEYICQKLDGNIEKAQEAFAQLSGQIARATPEDLFLSGAAFKSELDSFKTITFGFDSTKDSIHFSHHVKPQPAFNKHFNLLVEDLQNLTKQGYQNVILCSAPKQVERFYAIFEDIGAQVDFTPLVFTLHEGFVDHDNKLVAYTDHQIFERHHKFRLKTGHEKQQRITLKELVGLQVGDFVTHIDHGIGKFGGLQKIDVNGKKQEAIKLIYKDGDILYISIHSLHKIAKFNGQEGTAPAIHKLGGAAWNKLKQKAKKRVKEIAFDLIQLYAKRKASPGFAYSPDSYLQLELEASFIYEDTPDQLKSTNDVKQDMEAPHPMDRLICGDVGFGKTEIAIRAAFKAATDGKQVAILVPTTILAFQHYKTFKSRLDDFPVTVDYINRFKTAKKQKETLENLKSGKVDIIIGTHRLLGKDVQFKDLGLMIVDEEQKFGVAAKDKLKTMRVNVDTMTLTATPIPRTLQFSLMGARDLSIIQTPPPNRFPVQTEVRGFNEEAIRDAISYEISRNGQVFFIHNRIENIKEVAGMLSRLLPDARIGIGHGQMEGDKLEELMLGFMEGEFDVLVSTTIIESGLDIPNANTIIINNAHMFGLSDLHQMRGRVGRSNKKAFCYLLSPPLSTLSDEARKRLRAIEQFTDLGSGFNIAMRDLEIRGAGDMLGGEQTGFISDIGFDMYQKILNEAIEELKETEFQDLYAEDLERKKAQQGFVNDCQIDTDLELLIPDEYVNSIAERLDLYRRLDNLNNQDEAAIFAQELTDRFGPMPQQVEELLRAVELRRLAQKAGWEKLVLKNEKMIGYFIQDKNSPFYQSEVFTSELNYLKNHFGTVAMKEKNNRLSMTFERVKSVDQAIQIIHHILQP